MQSKQVAIEVTLSGHNLLSRADLNKGSAFTLEEREQFGLSGILPAYVETLSEQVQHCYMQYQQQGSDLQKKHVS